MTVLKWQRTSSYSSTMYLLVSYQKLYYLGRLLLITILGKSAVPSCYAVTTSSMSVPGDQKKTTPV